MDFFDREVRDGFDRMFDRNRDGKLDWMEQAMQYDYMERTFRDETDVDLDGDSDEEFDIDDLDLDDLNEDELEEALEDAGYDIDDFDFD